MFLPTSIISVINASKGDNPDWRQWMMALPQRRVILGRLRIIDYVTASKHVAFRTSVVKTFLLRQSRVVKWKRCCQKKWVDNV
jgi:hypothetical protein